MPGLRDGWLPLYVSLPGHPKLIDLCRRLKIEEHRAIGMLAELWCWAYKYAPEGDLSSLSPQQIAEAAHYKGNPDDFQSALISSRGPSGRGGFVDQDEEGGLWLHDWQDYVGELVDKHEKSKEQNRAAQKRHREKIKRELAAARGLQASLPHITSGLGNNDVRVRKALPDRTGHDMTGPDTHDVTHVTPPPSDVTPRPEPPRRLKTTTTTDQTPPSPLSSAAQLDSTAPVDAGPTTQAVEDAIADLAKTIATRTTRPEGPPLDASTFKTGLNSLRARLAPGPKGQGAIVETAPDEPYSDPTLHAMQLKTNRLYRERFGEQPK